MAQPWPALHPSPSSSEGLRGLNRTMLTPGLTVPDETTLPGSCHPNRLPLEPCCKQSDNGNRKAKPSQTPSWKEGRRLRQKPQAICPSLPTVGGRGRWQRSRGAPVKAEVTFQLPERKGTKWALTSCWGLQPPSWMRRCPRETRPAGAHRGPIHTPEGGRNARRSGGQRKWEGKTSRPAAGTGSLRQRPPHGAPLLAFQTHKPRGPQS